MTARRVVAALAALGPLGAAPAVARAAPLEAIEVDRDDEPPGQPELGFDAGAPIGDYAFAARAQYLDEPIVLRDGAATFVPVARRETLSLGGAVTLGTAIVVDATLPLAHQVGARLVGVPELAADGPLAHEVAGDLRVGARLRVGHGVFLRGELTAPTGDAKDFAGAPGWTYAWNLIGRLEVGGGAVLAGTAGVRLRGDEVTLGDRAVGDELDGAAGIVVPLPPIRPLWWTRDQLVVSAEVAGVVGDDVGALRGPSPVEARIGVVGRPRPAWQIGVRVGVGLDDEIGAPRVRALVELSWHAGKLEAPQEKVHERTIDESDDDLAEGDGR